MAMSIAKRLMLACAGVVVGGLGFFTPRADAGMMVDLRVSASGPTDPASLDYSYITPTLNGGKYEITGSTAGKYVLFDVVATVTGAPNITRTKPTRTTYQNQSGANRSPFDKVQAQGVVWAAGSAVISGYNGILPTSGAMDPTLLYQAGLFGGDATALEVLTNVPNYNNFAQGATTGFQQIVGGVARSVGPVAGDVDASNASAYVNFVTISDTRFRTTNDGVSLPAFPILGVSGTSSNLQIPPESFTFVLGQISLYFGNEGAAATGDIDLKWVPTPGVINPKGNQWVEDYITGPNLDGTNKLVNTEFGYYNTAVAKDAVGFAGFQVGNGLTLSVIVPEPATLGLFAVGALVCGLRRNRRK